MAIELEHCPVPWDTSPSQSSVTLTHTETGEAPICSVTLLGNYLLDGPTLADCFVRIDFDQAWVTRTGWHPDNQRVTDLPGFSVSNESEFEPANYLNWRETSWRLTGLCPDPGFLVATHCDWNSASLWEGPDWKHFIVDGLDGFVEIFATGASWRLWHFAPGQDLTMIEQTAVFADGQI